MPFTNDEGCIRTVIQPRKMISALVLAVQACAPVAGETPGPGTVDTAIAQTIEALTATAGPGIPVTGPTPTATLIPTDTAVPPTPTASLTLTPVPTFTQVVTPAVPQISVTVPTNCRVGPGRAYERVGGLLVGEVAEIVGRNAAGTYWIIENPDRPGTCWLWGEYALLAGNTNALPVYTPPPTPIPSPTPTPRPNFEASYDGLESCTDGGWWIDLALENTGGINFRSMALTVRDTVDNNLLSLYTDDFTDRDGCNEIDTRSNLPSGVTRIVSSPAFTYDPNGRELRATITVCSDPGQSGTCVTKVIAFTP